MKTFTKFLASLVLAVVMFPAATSAQLVVSQGGTGLTSVAANNILYGVSSSLRLGSESAFTYNPSTNLFTTTYASTTGFSATNADLSKLTLGSGTSTDWFISNASGTVMRGFGLSDCDAIGNAVTWDVTTGKFSCTTITSSGDGVSNWLFNGSRLTPSTTVGIGIFASSTIGNGTATGGLTISGNATTTGNIIVNGTTRLSTSLTGLLKSTSGVVSTASSGTDYEVPVTAGDGLTRTANDFDCDTASGSVFGCLSSADWTTFNNKETTLTFSNGLTRTTNNIAPTSGYNIPLTASTTNWNTFYNTPSNRITAGTNLSWSGNTLNATGGGLSDWLQTNGALTPTTTIGIRVNASSTIGDNTSTGGLTILGNATSTGAFRAPGGSLSSAAYSFSGDSDTGMYSSGDGSVSLATNGIFRLNLSSSAASFGVGITSAASSTIQFLTMTNSTTTNATSTSLFSTLGTFTNSVVTTLLTALNVTITGLLDLGAGVLEIPNGAAPTVDSVGELALDTTSNQLVLYGSEKKVIGDGNTYPAFSYSTSTAWTGTTTIPLGTAFVAETWNAVQCFTDAGTLTTRFGDGTNWMNVNNSSTTVGTTVLSTNNTFTAAEKRYVEVGTPASSPTKISCTINKSITAN